MLEKFFRDIIVGALGNYIEDFTEADVQIDTWNGIVVKDSCVIKTAALQPLSRSALGAPINVRTGFVRKIRINIPWSEILSKPVEVYLDDVHVVCDSPAGFDKEFMLKAVHKIKTQKFEALLQQFREQHEKQATDGEAEAAAEDKKSQGEQQETYLQRVQKIIKENLRFSLSNIHIRFEDSGVSRLNKSFNFAVTVDKVTYSSTNSKFERVFLNIDDKKREMRSFAMLEVNQLALYWNTNAQQNWSQNSEFVHLDCLNTIDFSKKYVENMKKKYNQNAQNIAKSQVYVIQPLDFSIKFRSNLNFEMQPHIPLSTSNYDISQLLISLDKEIFKDMQYLAKYFSWYQTAVKKELSHYKFRPEYNQPVKGNARMYWKYAIKSTLYYLRKAKQKANGQFKAKQQARMVELCELYKLKQFNEWVKKNYSSNVQKEKMVFKVDLTQDSYALENLQQLNEKIFKLECKLNPEQMVVAFTKAEKGSERMIHEEKQKAEWGNWISSSVMSFIGYGGQDRSQNQKSNEQTEKEFEQLMSKVQEFDNLEQPNEGEHKADKTIFSGHRTLSIPLIQLSLINKSMHQFGTKQFVTVVFQDIQLQQLSRKNDDSTQFLFSLKNFEIVDSLLNQQKFSRMIQKKEQQVNTGQIPETMRRILQRFQNDDSLSEIQEETNPNINNGMVQIQEYNLLKKNLEANQQYYIVINFSIKSETRQNLESQEVTLVKCYNLELMMTNLQIFYNSTLIKRVQEFVQQAKIPRVQNSSAEADFESKVEKLRQKTEQTVSTIFKKSEFQVNCNLKSIEVHIPDMLNDEMCKFIVVQTGDIHLRSGESKCLNSYFGLSNSVDVEFQQQIKQRMHLQSDKKDGDYRPLLQMTEFAMHSSLDKYSFMVYDFKILYFNSVEQHEHFMYSEISKGDIDVKHSLLKRMDVIFEYHTGRMPRRDDTEEGRQKFDHLQIKIESIDISLTNKELVQLHEFKGLLNQFKSSSQEKAPVEPLPQPEAMTPTYHDLSPTGKPSKSQTLQETLVSIIRKGSQSQRSSWRRKSEDEDSFHSAEQYQETGGKEDFEDDDFEDAQDYFDPEVIDFLSRIKSLQQKEADSDIEEEEARQIEQSESKRDKSLMVSVCIPKIRLSILEATDFEEELRGIQKKYYAELRSDQLEYNIKGKGVQFLQLEIVKTNLRMAQHMGQSIVGFYIKDLGFMNLEKKQDPRAIVQSSSYLYTGSMKKSFDENRRRLDPEDEDQIVSDRDYANMYEEQAQFDQFLEIMMVSSPQLAEQSINVGQTSVNISDQLIKKLYESFLKDLQEAVAASASEPPRPESQPLSKEPTPQKRRELKVLVHGIDIKLSDKQESVLIKIFNLRAEFEKVPEEARKSMHIKLLNLQVQQDNFDLISKHHGNFQGFMDHGSFSSQYQTNLFEFIQTQEAQMKTEEVVITDLLIGVDIKVFVVLAQICKSFLTQAVAIKDNRQSRRLVEGAQPKEQIAVSTTIVRVKDSFAQLAAKNGRNSLFLEVKDLSANLTKRNKQKTVTLNTSMIQLYVAQQFDQHVRYNHLSLLNIAIEAFNRSSKVIVDQITYTVNEYYIILLATLIEENFNDVKELNALASDIKRDLSMVKDASEAKPGIEEHPSIWDTSCYSFDRLFDKKQTRHIEKISGLDRTRTRDDQCGLSLLQLSQVKVEWVFGQTFDAHEEQFATLNERGITHTILQRFKADREEVHSDKEEDSETEANNRLIETSIKKVRSFFNKKDNSSHQLVHSQHNHVQNKKHQILQLYLKNTSVFSMSIDLEVPMAHKKADKFMSTDIQDGSISFLNQKDVHFPILTLKASGGKQAYHSELHTDVINEIGYCTVHICQANAQVICQLVKTIFQSKNAVYKSKVRYLLSKMFSVDTTYKYEDKEGLTMKKITTFNITGARIIMFDSSSMEKETRGCSSFHLNEGLQYPKQKVELDHLNDDQIDEITSEENNEELEHDKEDCSEEDKILHAQGQSILDAEMQKFNEQFAMKVVSYDSIQAKRAYIIDFKVFTIITRNTQWLLEQYEEEVLDMGLNKVVMLKLSCFEIYQNLEGTTLRELSEFNAKGTEFKPLKKQTILHPTDLSFKKGDFLQKPDFPSKQQSDIEISTTEIEISLKQIFKFRLLTDKILDRLQPVFKILDQQKKQSTKGHGNDTKAASNSQEKAIQKHSSTSLKINQFYVTLIKEVGNSVILEDTEAALANKYTPIFSFESKNILLRSQKLSDVQSEKLKMIIPFELYYFNQSLCFFEPLIERTAIEIGLEKNHKPALSKQLKIEVKKLFNVNLSVALFDSIFTFTSNFKNENTIYDQEKQVFQQSIANSNQNTSRGGRTSVRAKDQVHQLSSYFIKNETGEILMFKTYSQKAFQELEPEEEYPIDFQQHPQQFISQIDKHISELHAGRSESKRRKESKWKIVKELATSAIDGSMQFNSGDYSSSELDEEGSNSDGQQDQKEKLLVDHDEGSLDFILKKKLVLDEPEEEQVELTKNFSMRYVPVRSIFRRRNYKFLKSEPKKVQFQIVVQQGGEMEKTSVFEVNIENQSCQRIYLDDKKEFYVICQTQQADGKMVLHIRSPMQICNNLQIPLEITLSNNSGPHGILQHSSAETGSSNKKNVEISLMNSQIHQEILVQPEQSVNIPLRACGFNQIQLRPSHLDKKHSSSQLLRGDKKFEWTQKAEISLFRDESEIFEQPPVILESKLLRKNSSVERSNNKIFMVLNSNTYSIRSYVDFNTQQTEFISLRYISISSPFIFQNLIPAPITLLFKNISRQISISPSLKSMDHLSASSAKKDFNDRQTYDLDIKHNSQLQILFLNPLGNFDLSMVVPGYEQTNFIQFKQRGDEDLEICEEIRQLNETWKNRKLADKSLEVQESNQEQAISDKARFRFIQQKKSLFQLVSQFQNQFNVCANISFIQGQYYVSFYSKYWLLNNTMMPMEVQIKTNTFKFEKMQLPFQNRDFDFETIQKFQETEQGEEDDRLEVDKEGPKRKKSNDSLNTGRQADGQISSGGQGRATTSAARQLKGEDVSSDEWFRSLIKEQVKKEETISRIKPWEGYKFEEEEHLGFVGLLTQQDIDSVQTVYFTQEDYREESKSEVNNDKSDSKGGENTIDKLSQATSQREQRMIQAIKRSSAKVQHLDSQTMISKTSIQMGNYLEQIESNQWIKLIHTELSNLQLYDAPLKDQSQLKRVVLFSDNPQDESEMLMTNKKNQIKSQQEIIDHLQQSLQDDIKYISLKICGSDWSTLPFDETKLQSESILLRDQVRRHCSRSLYEIVANIQYLPSPFNFSKIIEFKPRYMIVNKTFEIIQIIQSECEEKGIFKIYPGETSVFHWTDCNKPYEINVKFEEHEYSGNIKIDGIGEICIRLRGSYNNESVILSVSITEERNTLYILINDVSYAPPYRIENLTKASFKIQQVLSRDDDFDILHAYQIIPYAWSYPLNEKLLKISLNSSGPESHLASVRIDQLNKSEKVPISDKKGERKFLLEIINEKSMKVIRILYISEFSQEELENNTEELDLADSEGGNKIQLIIRQQGLSIINSQSRELAYLFVSNFKILYEKQSNNNKFVIKAENFQIDNQLVRKNDEIIIKRDFDAEKESSIAAKYFFNVKGHYIKNSQIENLHFFRYFYFMLTPINLNLDGNFCDEMFRYISDVLQLMRKYQESSQKRSLGFYDKEITDIDKLKKAFEDIKKPYELPGREVQVQKKVYFEEFYLHDIQIKFTFNSSPIMFREFSMNPSLKFFIVLMSNLKNLRLRFGSFKVQQQQMLMSIFLAQVRRHYLQQCYNHTAIIKLISSMGLFGNLSESLTSLSNAFESLVHHPWDEDNVLKGFAIAGVLFVKQSIGAIAIPFQSVWESCKNGAQYIVQSSLQYWHAVPIDQEQANHKDILDDVEEISRDFNSFTTPLNIIDTQNRIWLKIITKEQLTEFSKRQVLRKQQQILPSNEQDAVHEQVGNEAENVQENDEYEEPDQHQALRKFYHRQHDQGSYPLIGYTKELIHKAYQNSMQAIDSMNTRMIEEQRRSLVQKVRYPRFTSFTMQLEAYSYKKAYALEILNDINLNVLHAESIQKLFTLEEYEIIFTEKRIICVQGLAKRQSTGSNQIDSSRGPTGTHQIYNKVENSVYQHWSTLFEDVMKLKMEIALKEGSYDAAGQRQLKLVPKEEQALYLQGNGVNAGMHDICMIFRILFTVNENGQPSGKRSDKASDSLISDFRIGSHDLVVESRDFRTLKKVCKEIFERSKQHLM